MVQTWHSHPLKLIVNDIFQIFLTKFFARHWLHIGNTSDSRDISHGEEGRLEQDIHVRCWDLGAELSCGCWC